MVPIRVNALILLLILIISIEVFSPFPPFIKQIKEINKNRKICVDLITVSFRSENIFKHGQQAIHKYKENQYYRDNMNDIAWEYYLSFKYSLMQGDVKSPNDFCTDMNEKEGSLNILEIYKDNCYNILTAFFGNTALDAIYAAFYIYELEDIKQMKTYNGVPIPVYNRSNLRFYFTSIHDHFGIDVEQRDCLGEIMPYFKGDDVYAHGRIAINKYTESIALSEWNSMAKEYYESFRDYLREGSVLPPEEFCSDANSKKFKNKSNIRQCLKWLTRVFGNNALTAVEKSFYTYTLREIQNMKKFGGEHISHYGQCNLKYYFTSIRNGYGLQAIGFKNRDEFCAHKFPIPAEN